MRSVFERRVDITNMKDMPLSAYRPEQLCAYLLRAYPNDPIGALRLMREKLEIGSVLAQSTRLLLEGVVNDKRD